MFCKTALSESAVFFFCRLQKYVIENEYDLVGDGVCVNLIHIR